MNKHLPIFWLLLFVLGTFAEAAPLRLAGAFKDHAIVQRDKPVPVWGWAEPGAKVAVQFAGQDKAATADAAGKWMVTLAPMPASAAPRELVTAVRESKQEPRITDVLVGDVFLLGNLFSIEGPPASPFRTAGWSAQSPLRNERLLTLNRTEDCADRPKGKTMNRNL